MTKPEQAESAVLTSRKYDPREVLGRFFKFWVGASLYDGAGVEVDLEEPYEAFRALAAQALPVPPAGDGHPAQAVAESAQRAVCQFCGGVDVSFNNHRQWHACQACGAEWPEGHSPEEARRIMEAHRSAIAASGNPHGASEQDDPATLFAKLYRRKPSEAEHRSGAAQGEELRESALVRFNRLWEFEYGHDPEERLRFFCSLAMNGQDWLDVEPFFDALLGSQALSAPDASDHQTERDSAAMQRPVDGDRA